MPGFELDARGLFSLGRQFGSEGTRFTLDAIEAAVTSATATAAASAKTCLKTKWPKSSISRKVTTAVRLTSRGVVGIMTIKHKWVGPLALGERVPAHTIQGRPTLAIKVNTKKEPNRLDEGALSPDRQRLFKPKVSHPGYKGKDCVTAAQKLGTRKLDKLIQRAALRLAQKLSKGR